MTELKIPEPGVMLGVQDPEPKTQQAFILDLSDDVIEGMIRCAEQGKDMQLALGGNPTLHYGNNSHRIHSPPPDDDFPSDLYLTQPFKALREAHQIPTMPIFSNPRGLRVNKPTPRVETTRVKKSDPPRKSETDRKGLLKKPIQPTKLSTTDLKSSARALSASPSLKPVASPSHNGIADQAKLDRAPLVHELAIKPQTSDYLREKWRGKPEGFNKALEKVADQVSGKWVLRAKAWQELDVWNYDYHAADRELVISAAIPKYDKARISPSDSLWEKLVPKHERGKGKGARLTTVQKRIAEGPAAAVPKIAVNRVEESSNSSKDDDNSSEKSKSEPMARTNSKTKKTASEAQASRLLGKTKAKPASQSKVKPDKSTPISTPKTSPAKSKAQPNGKKVLSAEIVENSDSSGDEVPPPKPKAAPKPAEKPMSAEKTAPKPAVKSAPKPAPKRPAPEDEDSSSSSSGIPLSKRHKVTKPQSTSQQRKRTELQQPPPRQPPPPRDYSRYNYKNTSPTKSSPLASSPPTNVSDMSSSSDDRLAASTKRKAIDDGRTSTKRRYSEQFIRRAQNFKAQYDRYAALHYEVDRMTHPPQNKLDELNTMHESLKKLKERIYRDEGLTRD